MCSALGTAAILHGNYHTSDAWFLVLSFSLNSKKVIAYNFLCLWLLVGPISLNHEIPFTLMIPHPPCPNLSHKLPPGILVSQKNSYGWCPALDVFGNHCLYCLYLHILFKFLTFLIYQILAIPLRSYTALWLESDDKKFHKTTKSWCSQKAFTHHQELFSTTSS